MKAYVYILTTAKNTTLYTGVSSDLISRLKKHLENFYQGSFTQKYNVKKLVYFELHPSISEAIKREKQIKAGSREKKIRLIESINPDWNDLSGSLNS
ncbi:MAG: GIY-YIG nuclease family protein [Bacteroidales bacterium]